MIEVKFNKTQTFCANLEQGGCLIVNSLLTYHEPISKNGLTFIKPISGYGVTVFTSCIQSIEHVKPSEL